MCRGTYTKHFGIKELKTKKVRTFIIKNIQGQILIFWTIRDVKLTWEKILWPCFYLNSPSISVFFHVKVFNSFKWPKFFEIKSWFHLYLLDPQLLPLPTKLGEVMFSPLFVSLSVCLFVNNLSTTILVVESWNFQGLIVMLLCGSD